MNILCNPNSLAADVVSVELVNHPSSLNTLPPMYVITLRGDVFRRSHVSFLMARHHLSHTMVVVDRPCSPVPSPFQNTGEWGCYRSHLWCLSDAIGRGYETFIIFEDDILLHREFPARLQTVCNTMRAQHLDMVMLGSCDFNLKHNLTRLDPNARMYRPERAALGSHATMYTGAFAADLVRLKQQTPRPYDEGFQELYDSRRIAVCYPNLVICELTTTNIGHNFSPLVPRRYNSYLSRCFSGRLDYAQYDMFFVKFLEFVYHHEELFMEAESMAALIRAFVGPNRLAANIMRHCSYSMEDVKKMVSHVKKETT